MSTRKPISFIATTDANAARRFYGDILGLMHLESSPYACVFADGENMLRIQIVPALEPAAHTVHGWQVDDIETEIRDLQAKGVVFEIFEFLKQSPSGVWTTPDGHKIAWFKDPSGNILSLTEMAT